LDKRSLLVGKTRYCGSFLKLYVELLHLSGRR